MKIERDDKGLFITYRGITLRPPEKGTNYGEGDQVENESPLDAEHEILICTDSSLSEAEWWGREVALSIDVKKCERCHRDHDRLPCYTLSNPMNSFSYWAICPETLEPLLVEIAQTEGES